MDVERFLEHHGLSENPFGAEEARHDPVFERIVVSSGMSHPELVKVLGSADRPHSSVVFGEKGSGKTALRLLMAQRIGTYNRENADRRTLMVAYDDFNPVLDTVARSQTRTAARGDPDRLLASFRLEDHQDAILSIAVTKLVDGILGTGPQGIETMLMPQNVNERVRKLPRGTRVDIAALAALYDSPRGAGGSVERWKSLVKKLRLGWRPPVWLFKSLVGLLTILAVGLFLAPFGHEWLHYDKDLVPWWTLAAAGVAAGVALLGWSALFMRRFKVWRLSRRILKECHAIERDTAQMGRMLTDIPKNDRIGQPWPRPGGDGTNARYELTAKLIGVLGHFDHNSIVVFIDRVDEPTLVAGRPERMRGLVWPLFDSKFMQQDSIGLKLLLPIELRYMMKKEDASFFQEARLDKQSMVDRLAWTGATLYDICTARLRACHRDRNSDISLTDLFAKDTTRDALIEALTQMQQPRDAFKMVYAVMLEHCSNVPTEDEEFRIPRLTLESIRRQQAQRINDLQRGLSPA